MAVSDSELLEAVRPLWKKMLEAAEPVCSGGVVCGGRADAGVRLKSGSGEGL